MWEYSICFTIGNHKHLILPLTFLSFCLPSSFPPSFLSFFLFYLREGKLFFCLYMKLTFILLYSSFENNNCSHICWKYNISLTKSLKERKKVLVTQSCLTLSDPMDRSLPGSSVHGIFWARVLEWGAIAFSKCLCYWTSNYTLSSKAIDRPPNLVSINKSSRRIYSYTK